MLLAQCQVGEARIDYGAVIQRQPIVLANMPEGSARVVFSDADFGHFLQHPLMQAAASTAVGGQPFVFEQSVRVERMSQHAPMGVVEMVGVWRGDGRRYAVRLMPAGLAGAAAAAGPQQQGRAVGSRDAGVSGVIVRAAPAEAAARTGAPNDNGAHCLVHLAVHLLRVCYAYNLSKCEPGEVQQHACRRSA